jgi:hypothetical protein
MINRKILLKSLIYFEDAEQDPEPIMLKSMTWSKVKSSLTSQVENYFTNH